MRLLKDKNKSVRLSNDKIIPYERSFEFEKLAILFHNQTIELNDNNRSVATLYLMDYWRG